MTAGLGLDDAYGARIERIKEQGGDKSRLGMEALMWISHAERPLIADQLCPALAFELDSADFNPGNIPSIETLVSYCQGLVTVEKEASTVRLIYFTLNQYFPTYPDIFIKPHTTMAEICLTYLNSQQIKALDPSSPLDYNSFLGYCSLYWGVHAKQDLCDYARSLTLQRVREYDQHASIRFLVQHTRGLNFFFYSSFHSLGRVQCASFFGSVKVVAALTEMQGYRPNRAYFFGRFTTCMGCSQCP